MTVISDEDVLAIDIGGTKIALANIRNNQIIDRLQIATPRTGKGVDIVRAISEQAALLPPAKRAAVATTGIVDEGCLTALNPATLPIENRFPLVDALKAELSMPLFAVNDAQAAAWAEHRMGAGKQAARMAFVTVSTGIGGGLVLDGTLQIGGHGLAGHVGHMVADPSGSQCGCGRQGCVERLASGTAIGRVASERLGRVVAAPEVFALAAQGDETCADILRDTADFLANILCDLVASLDLELILLGGGVGLADGFVELVRNAIIRQPAIFHRPIARAELGADAGLVGVALLPF